MAELATGAVSTLLGVISHEAARLGRVRVDMQFIQEEMESMSSFLANLATTRREHDEQIRTWMNQVRILANDCNSCIDLYLYRGDPEFHRPRAGLGRFLWRGPWLLRKMLAQHRAAGQLRELKDRARDIGDRRLRYGVEVKTDQSSSTDPLRSQTATTQDHEEDEDDDDEEEDSHDQDHDKVASLSTTTMDMNKEEYLNWKLDQWIPLTVGPKTSSGKSIAFLVHDTKEADALAIRAREVVMAHLKRGAEEDMTHEDEGAVQKQSQNKWDVVLVDLPKVHLEFVSLQPGDILYYIHHELKKSQQQQQGTASLPDDDIWSIFFGKNDFMSNSIWKVYDKIEEIKKSICQVLTKEEKKLDKDNKISKQKLTGDEPLNQLLWLLIKSTTDAPATAAEQDQKNKLDIRTLIALHDDIINITTKKLKEEVEMEMNPGGGSKLEEYRYGDILREVFPRPTTATAAAATSSNSTNTTLVDNQIKEIIQGVKEMLYELRELDYYSHKNNNREEPAYEPAETREAYFEEATKKKMEEIGTKIAHQLETKVMIDMIEERLGDDKRRILVILKTDDDKHLPAWEETRKALSMLGCVVIAGAMVVATKTTHYRDNEESLCYRSQLELVEYPLIGRFLDTMLKSTRQHMHEDSHRILRDILYECDSYEFCMKIFAHALYAKPKRSTEELRKLHTTMQAKQGSVARKMINFSYKDLPKEYRSCLLYLAIFPKGFPMRRSTLIGRWVAEGLITTKEWRWSSSVDEAEKCFDTLIARYLVCPADTGATGRVKSFTVHKQVYKFITKIAKKQHILETRLSDHLARHFSIFSGIRLRRSEQVKDFLQNIPNSSQFSKLKVLDLEDCDCFPDYQGYLRDVCSKIVMLKYLSLRKTNVTHLPGEINNLHELEVLDIRQTRIPAYETRNVLLRKLKRLLAGQHIDSSPSNSDARFSSVQIPEKIEKMESVEVLSNMEPQSWYDLNNIAKLGMLKKLGVVINKDSHLEQLFLRAVDDLLYRGLRSMSITLDIEETSRHNDRCDLPTMPVWKSTNVLESLSITGTTRKWKLLTAFANVAKQLAKVTLSYASVSEDDMKVLAKLPNLRCVRLRHIGYTHGSKLIFTAGGFENLNSILIEGSKITEIRFEDGATSKLEKIIWSFTKIDSLSGIGKLPRLKELELKGETIPIEVDQDIERQKIGFPYKHIKPENQDQSTGDHARETEAAARCPSLWKAKGWRRRN